MGGGDSGGSESVRIQQAQDEARKAQARAAINNLFGIDPGTITTTKPGFFGMDRTIVSRPYSPEETAANKASLEAGYTDLGQRVKDAYLPDLTQNRDVTQRNLRFQLARQGLNKSSEELTQGNQLSRNWDTALRNLESTSLEAQNKARSSDEATRLNLMNAINSGLDQGTALSTAANQLKFDTQDAADYVKGRTLGDFTKNLAVLNNANNIGIGRTDARRVYNQLFSPGAGKATGGNNGVIIG